MSTLRENEGKEKFDVKFCFLEKGTKGAKLVLKCSRKMNEAMRREKNEETSKLT